MPQPTIAKGLKTPLHDLMAGIATIDNSSLLFCNSFRVSLGPTSLPGCGDSALAGRVQSQTPSVSRVPLTTAVSEKTRCCAPVTDVLCSMNLMRAVAAYAELRPQPSAPGLSARAAGAWQNSAHRQRE